MRGKASRRCFEASLLLFALACTCACTRRPAERTATSSTAVPESTTSVAANAGAREHTDAGRATNRAGESRLTGPAADATPPALSTGGAHVVSGTNGLVVSVEENATRAGAKILEAGGNAVDAAVAVALALAVTHPSAGNLGGGGFLLYRPKGGQTVAIDFREKAPLGVTQAAFDRMIAARAVGPAAAGVPGSVAGLDLALSRFGRLPRGEIFASAIELAKKGFALSEFEAKSIGWAWPDLSKSREARSIFGKKGKPLRAGDRLVQPALAATLERVRDGADAGFYEGATAAAITALRSEGGMISAEDLSRYRAIVREPLRTRYRGFEIDVAPPPSAGGVAVAILLGSLEKLGAYRLPNGSADALHLFAEVARRAHAVRRFDVVDPDSVAGYDLAKKEAEWLDIDAFLKNAPPIDMHHATPSSSVSPLYAAAMRELEHTTHFAVVDREGNAVSCTTTLSAGFGSKSMAAGVVLNDSLAAFGTAGANVLSPGRRMTTSMSPTLVVRGNDTVLVLGSPGGDTIANTVVEVLRNLVDYGMTLDRAVGAPRIHQGFVPDEIRYEGGRPPPQSVLDELSRRGHRLSKKTAFIGDANSILVDGTTAYGYADDREGGLAVATAPPAASETR